MRKRVLLIVLLATALIAGVPGVAALIRAQSGLDAARDLLAHQLWPQARQRLAGYLWLHPHDAQARLLMAEALAKDDALAADFAATEAIACLAQISDDSPLAAEAKTQQGRLYFLVLQKPGRAEELLREAIERGAGLPADRLLWTVLCFTGKSEWSDEVFWRIYEQSSEDERPLRLREWYMNQFFPISAHESLDRMLGVLAPQETPTRMSESQRYLRFRDREPEAPLTHAAVAQWCQQEGDPQFALRVLEAARKELPEANADPFFLSVSIATDLDLGYFDEAQANLERWPQRDRGHSYWKWRGTILDGLLQHEAALEAYDRALALWPGQADWRLHHRRAACLARLKKSQEAEAAQRKTSQVTAMMKPEAHERLRLLLASLDKPEPLAEVVQFYRKLGCDREADGWDRHLRRLHALAGPRVDREAKP